MFARDIEAVPTSATARLEIQSKFGTSYVSAMDLPQFEVYAALRGARKLREGSGGDAHRFRRKLRPIALGAREQICPDSAPGFLCLK